MAGSSSRLHQHLQQTSFEGGLPDADVIGGANVDGRPPEAVIFLKLAAGRIANAGFQSSGCGYLRACCSALLELVLGKTTADSAELQDRQLIEYLGNLPDTKQYCATLAVIALRNALTKLSLTAPGKECSR
jgi:NifU-like protein involved in Fe-S cluster formation